MPPCPVRGCDGEREPRQYLCRRCWYALPVEQRRRLRLTDRRALERLARLYDQVCTGTTPADVEVPA